MIKTFWLSFCDEDRPKGQQFLGVCVVDVTDEMVELEKIDLDLRFPRHAPGAEWIAAATRKAWAEGCNPGGQVASVECPQDHPDILRYPRNRLLSKYDLAELNI